VKITVRVPATSANLGPGFDCFGLALELCNEVMVDTEAEPVVAWEGEGAGELPRDGSDLISRTIRELARNAGVSQRPFSMRAINRIPLERGLGSSSSAAVAGVLVASRLYDLPIDETGHGPDPSSVFSNAAAIEGHPDNAAPAVFGGVTIALPDGFVHRADPHPALRPVLLIPDEVRLPTADARAALTSQVSRSDAVFNLAHSGLLALALVDDPRLLGRAMRDRLHQRARLSLVPEVEGVFEGLRASGIPVCVSGAGPTLLAFDTDDAEVPNPGEGWRVLRVAPRRIGSEVTLTDR
jgi:homoserine kinase